METLKITGTYKIDIKDTNGVTTTVVKNIVTNAGKAQLALLAGDAAAVPFSYIALGTSSTAAAASQTALGAEITDTGLQRVAGTVSRVTTNVTNDTFQVVYTFTATGSKTVEEVGVFNDATTGTMLSRAVTGSLALVNGNQVTITYKLVIS